MILSTYELIMLMVAVVVVTVVAEILGLSPYISVN